MTTFRRTLPLFAALLFALLWITAVTIAVAPVHTAHDLQQVFTAPIRALQSLPLDGGVPRV